MHIACIIILVRLALQAPAARPAAALLHWPYTQQDEGRAGVSAAAAARPLLPAAWLSGRAQMPLHVCLQDASIEQGTKMGCQGPTTTKLAWHPHGLHGTQRASKEAYLDSWSRTDHVCCLLLCLAAGALQATMRGTAPPAFCATSLKQEF